MTTPPPPPNLSEDVERMTPSLFTAFLMVIPNAMMWRTAAKRGGGVATVNAILRSPVGAYGLFAIPFVGLAGEKCFYDSSMALQGIDPNALRPDRKDEGYPSGGHALPSLSLFPVKHVREYFR
ncbi:hypothetical protein NFJ02_44g111630 [Pycnococcus provasolii]